MGRDDIMDKLQHVRISAIDAKEAKQNGLTAQECRAIIFTNSAQPFFEFIASECARHGITESTLKDIAIYDRAYLQAICRVQPLLDTGIVNVCGAGYTIEIASSDVEWISAAYNIAECAYFKGV